MPVEDFTPFTTTAIRVYFSANRIYQHLTFLLRLPGWWYCCAVCPPEELAAMEEKQTVRISSSTE